MSPARGPISGPNYITYIRPATGLLARGPHFADPCSNWSFLFILVINWIVDSYLIIWLFIIHIIIYFNFFFLKIFILLIDLTMMWSRVFIGSLFSRCYLIVLLLGFFFVIGSSAGLTLTICLIGNDDKSIDNHVKDCFRRPAAPPLCLFYLCLLSFSCVQALYSIISIGHNQFIEFMFNYIHFLFDFLNMFSFYLIWLFGLNSMLKYI